MLKQTISVELDARLRAALAARGINLDEPRALAAQVMKLSDFYLENPGVHTPWDESFAVPAYLAYFLPLNFARLRGAFAEVKRFLHSSHISAVTDYGSGLGTTQWVLEDALDYRRPLFAVERSRRARDLHAELCQQSPTLWTAEWREPSSIAPGTLGVFSYSFLEMQQDLPPLDKFSHLLIVEPSTRNCGRELMEWRAKLIGQGFQPLAPCTHAGACPLLVHSNRDWCHQRIHFEGPEWFQRLENFLPMKNRTLTFSYLLMSRDVRDGAWRGGARAIGDTIHENGKTRQMICRGEKREFLSWLHKHGEPEQIPHGALIRDLENCEVKGNELRVLPGQVDFQT